MTMSGELVDINYLFKLYLKALEGWTRAIPNKVSFTRARTAAGGAGCRGGVPEDAGAGGPGRPAGRVLAGGGGGRGNGFTLDVPDTEVNRTRSAARCERQWADSGISQGRVVTLTEDRDHSSIDARLGVPRRGSRKMAISLARARPGGW